MLVHAIVMQERDVAVGHKIAILGEKEVLRSEKADAEADTEVSNLGSAALVIAGTALEEIPEWIAVLQVDGTPVENATAGTAPGMNAAVDTVEVATTQNFVVETAAFAYSNTAAEVPVGTVRRVAGRSRVGIGVGTDEVSSENARPHVSAAATG